MISSVVLFTTYSPFDSLPLASQPVLLSMTGFGDARLQTEKLSLSVEVRTVNNRYFKLNLKLPDRYSSLEPEIEKLVREQVSRGSIQLAIRYEAADQPGRLRLNVQLLEQYADQISEVISRRSGVIASEVRLDSLTSLPGVVEDNSQHGADLEVEWPQLSGLIGDALKRLQDFRRHEGESMGKDLSGQASNVSDELKLVEQLAPQVVAEYRVKMLDRVRQTLAESDVTLTESDLIREVAIFADRCDINEEITRLKCHLGHFDSLLNDKTSQGRKLEFLTQEMFREINTIGSKANNVSIAHAVVEMKASVERIREVLQNVE